MHRQAARSAVLALALAACTSAPIEQSPDLTVARNIGLAGVVGCARVIYSELASGEDVYYEAVWDVRCEDGSEWRVWLPREDRFPSKLPCSFGAIAQMDCFGRLAQKRAQRGS